MKTTPLTPKEALLKRIKYIKSKLDRHHKDPYELISRDFLQCDLLPYLERQFREAK